MASINIRKRGKYYQYSFEIAKVGGKRKQKTKSGFKTKAEAQAEGTKAYNDYLSTGLTFSENDISYSDYLDYWMENYCKANLKYNTISKYDVLIRKYIKPYLGEYRLSAITNVKITTYINEICKEYNFSRGYFRSILKVIKGSFRDATDIYGYIKQNPALTIRLPKLVKESEDIKHLYTNEEIETILERFKDDSTFICAFLTACYTGMRTGEIFALTWDDIDFENKIIKINHSVYEKKNDGNGRWFVGSTKTETGKRIVYICPTLYNALVNYKKKKDNEKKQFGSKYTYYHLESVDNGYNNKDEYRIVKNKINDKERVDFVFTKEDGKYAGKDIIKYPFSVIHKELGIKQCRFYDLRGSYATRILNNGAEIRDVANILGHKNIETTENYYISSTKDGREYASRLFEKNLQSDLIKKVSMFS